MDQVEVLKAAERMRRRWSRDDDVLLVTDWVLKGGKRLALVPPAVSVVSPPASEIEARVELAIAERLKEVSGGKCPVCEARRDAERLRLRKLMRDKRAKAKAEGR